MEQIQSEQQKQPDNQPTLESLEEIQLSDGQTESLPEMPEELSLNPQALPGDLSAGFPATMTSSQYYSKDEFAQEFNDFLLFLKSPQTSADAFEALRAEGQGLAASKLYEMAQKYKWLRFIIDRRTQVVHDTLVLSIFAITETNAIVYNWTGISLIEKGRIWLKGKIKNRAEAARVSGKRSVWGFLARRGAEKQPRPANLSENLTAWFTLSR